MTNFNALLDLGIRKLAKVQKQEESADVLKAMEGLKEGGIATKWGKAMDTCGSRRSVAMGELKLVGVKDPGIIAVASTRNELAFLVTVVGVSSVLAVAAGALLPGARRLAQAFVHSMHYAGIHFTCCSPARVCSTTITQSMSCATRELFLLFERKAALAAGSPGSSCC